MFVAPIIYNTYNPNTNHKKSPKVNFGQIEPEHLFINIKGFNKDYNWAGTMVEHINKTIEEIRKGKNFKEILDSIANNYSKYFSEHYLYDKSQKCPFGLIRQGKKDMDHVLFVNKYRSYRDKFIDFFNKLPNIEAHNDKFSTDTKIATLKQKLGKSNKSIELASMEISNEDIPIFLCGTEKLVLYNMPPTKSIKPVFKYLDQIYKEIAKIKTVKTKEELDSVNKKIAEMHWYFIQLMPYKRGSAGIADILTKSIYESLGIQVSSWKQGVAPDLEALVRPLDDYVMNYPLFFEKPPEIMKQ